METWEGGWVGQAVELLPQFPPVFLEVFIVGGQ